MGWNAHPISGILTIEYGNVTNLNILDNYGQMNASEITTHATN